MEANLYKILSISEDAAELPEQLGTKYKFWFHDPDFVANRGLTLFKEGRPETGENWAEKIACELASLLKIPRAQYEFAKFKNMQGVASRVLIDFTAGARLIHGNEILSSYSSGYGGDAVKPYQRREHTLRRVLGYFRASSETVGVPVGFEKDEYIQTSLDVFIGYLMFDAWIANQDRHDQNWALLRSADGNSFLSPTYDHGSSMGRNERDEKRVLMLNTKDMGQHISHYVTTARSSFYPHVVTGKVKSVSTLEAFTQAARQNPVAAHAWKDRLAQIGESAIVEVFDKVPEQLMTKVAREFTMKLLQLNQQRILKNEI